MNDGIRTMIGRSSVELSVIVVGVLIALAVDSWNTSRADVDLEAYYLESLAEDLRSDSSAFANSMFPRLAQKDSALRLVTPFVRGGPVQGDTLALLNAVGLGGLLGSGATGLRLARRTTFDELIASGNLELIRSRPLRAAVVSYYSAAEVRSAQLLGRAPGYPMAVHAYYPAEVRGDDGARAAREFGFARAVQGFRSEAFVSVMNQEINYMHAARRTIELAAVAANELLRAVEANLLD